MGLFLALGWPVEARSTAQTVLPLHSMFLITITSSFFCMETQVVQQINTIKPSGQLLYLYSTLITLVIKGNNPQNTFQVVCACVRVCVCVGGWMKADRGGHSILTSNYVTFKKKKKKKVIPYYVLTCSVSLSSSWSKRSHTKGEDYRKSGKTKLITWGISTSQCCLKCNYMGLEPWLRLWWLQISHWQTCSLRKICLPLKMTAGQQGRDVVWTSIMSPES